MAQTDKCLHWQTSIGYHDRTKFEVSHPPEWEIHNLPTAALVACRQDPNALVSFMWFNGTGAMDPNTLLNETIHYNRLQDYELLHATPIQVLRTPPGPYSSMEQEALFTYRGERCRHHVYIQVNEAIPPYLLVWSGSMVWCQAPALKWEEDRLTLDRIASSFRVVQGGL